MITVRPMRREDCADLTALLNHTIALGGTTAYEQPFTEAGFAEEFIGGDNVCSLVAEADGRLAGFQVLIAFDRNDLTRLAIATFADQRQVTLGVGRALMAETKNAAKALGCNTIDAKIRADNTPGLGYYGKMGFKEVDRMIAVPLSDGTPVDRVIRRFEF